MGRGNGATHQPKSLSEAISQLEIVTREKSSELKNMLGEDFEELKNAINEIKPHLRNVKDQAAQAAKTSVQEGYEAVRERMAEQYERAERLGKTVDEKVHEHPWMAMGIVGLIMFLIGLVIGRSR